MMFLIPAVGVPNEYMLQDTLKSAIAAFGILLATLFWLLDISRHPRPLRWHWVMFLPPTLCLYALGSMAWSHTYLASVEAIRWFFVSLLAVLTLNVITTDRLVRVLWGVHSGAFVAASIAYAQFMFGVTWFPEVAMPGSTFLNKNFFSEYLCAVMPISLLLIRQSKSLGQLATRSASVAFMTTTVLMAGSRAAYVALVPIGGLLLLAVFSTLRTVPEWSKEWKHLTIALIFGGIALLGSIPSLNSNLPSGTSALSHASLRSATLAAPTEYTEGSFSVRVQMWKATARMILEHPLGGVGAGSWEVEIPLYQSAKTVTEIDYYAHNELLQLISEYGGLVGGLVLAFFAAFLIRYSLVAVNSRNALSLSAGISTWCLLLVACAGFPLHLAAGTSLFGILLGVLAKTATDTDARPSPVTLPNLFLIGLKFGLLLCLIGATTITVLAVRVESNLMKATFSVVRARGLSGEERQSRLEEANMLALDALHFNSHYRKLTAILGDQFAAAGAWPQAVQLWSSVAQSRPNIPALWAYIAIGHAELGDHIAAQQALEKVQKLMPGAPSTRNLELRLASFAGQADEVANTLTHLLDEGDFDYERIQVAYVVGYRHKNWPLTIKALTLRAKHWPDSAADAYLRIGKIYQQLGGIENQQKAQHAFAAGLNTVPVNERERYLAESRTSDVN